MANRDYANLWPRVVDKIFDDLKDKATVLKFLGRYQYGEGDRVKLGILKVADGSLSEVKRLVKLANQDYRDLLVLAEFQYSAPGSSFLSIEEPEMCRALEEQESKEYDNWLEKVLD